jgi:glycosyltransferase involved in cell wall biosynthesis
MKVAVVLGVFPKRSERFLVRELLVLGRLGLELQVFALESGEAALLAEEPFRTLAPRVSYLPHFFSARALAAQARSAATRPGRLLKLAPAALGGSLADPRRMAALLPRLAWAPALARAVEGTDCRLVWAHFASLPGAVGWLAANLAGRPFALSCHAWDIFVNRALVAAQLAGARLVTACSRAALNHLRTHYGRAADGVELVYHGLPQPPVAGNRPPATGQPLRVLAAGRLVPKKGFRYLVEAAALSPGGFTLEIAGEGAERGALEKLIAARKLATRVGLLGELDEAGLRAACERADAFCAPSVVDADGDRDGVPNSLLEAMSAGLPAVAANAGGLSEAVVHGRSGLIVPPADPQALADAIERLGADGALRERLAAGARDLLRERFALDHNAAQLAGLLLAAGEP